MPRNTNLLDVVFVW